ncbi:BTB/POZ and MATH domain-containing protein 3-like [Triticum urartu]|uniref:BTB/POZ and MATH domain-containing protein 3-like n=1 Tax=Triticum urartu TaxID=4572 RepID=UPI002043E666|nr:BTB/POZ and MATH domain-containing protein 3-like [Triticum urartu]XP_048534986.1 BTB/POZ and MATH domain-containing protein 3-like [Triticum urartu]
MAFAGVSLIADGRLCASTESVFDSGADSGYHLLVVEGYSRTKETIPNRDFIQSRPFIVGGRRWKVDYHPNGYGSGDEDFISVFLELDESVRSEVQAHVAFSFIDQPELRVPNLIRQSQPCCFYYDCSDTAYQPGRFVTREAFERSNHLKNDSFVIRCDVIVLDRKDDEDEEEEHERARPFIKLPPSDLPSHFSDLLLSKEGADITFEVGSKKLAAHRCVLAARSTVFKKQLFGSMDKGAAAPSVVKIDGIEASVFEALLTFIYTDGLPDLDRMHVCEGGEKDATWLLQLLEAAERYDLQKLKFICEEKFANLICENRVADVIVVAERKRCRWLKEACLEFIKTHTSLHTVLTADGLEQIIRTGRPSVLQELISTFASHKGAAVGAVVQGGNDTGASGQAEDGSKKRKVDARHRGHVGGFSSLREC